LRVTPEGAAVITVPALGGQEKTIGLIPVAGSYDWILAGRLLAWSPDGQWLALSWPNGYSGNTRLCLLSAQTGEVRDLTQIPPPASGIRDHSPAFSPDGRSLAFGRSSSPTATDLFVLPLSEGYKPAARPRQLTNGPGLNDGPAWTPSGTELLFHS